MKYTYKLQSSNMKLSNSYFTLYKNKFSIKNFFSKCDQIGSFLRIKDYIRNDHRLKIQKQISKKQCNKKYCFCDKTCLLSAL